MSRATLAIFALLTAGLPRTAAKDTLVGEFKEQVSSCRCLGRNANPPKHGYCGFHFHLGSAEASPWCRTMHNCGNSSSNWNLWNWRGSWAHCDERGVERRSYNQKFYSALEMYRAYPKDSKKIWMERENAIERRGGLDGGTYTVREFRDYYVDGEGETGWVAKWIAAEPGAGKLQDRDEHIPRTGQRRAPDGECYTWESFVDWYGDKAKLKWGVAGECSGGDEELQDASQSADL